MANLSDYDAVYIFLSIYYMKLSDPNFRTWSDPNDLSCLGHVMDTLP